MTTLNPVRSIGIILISFYIKDFRTFLLFIQPNVLKEFYMTHSIRANTNKIIKDVLTTMKQNGFVDKKAEV